MSEFLEIFAENRPRPPFRRPPDADWLGLGSPPIWGHRKVGVRARILDEVDVFGTSAPRPPVAKAKFDQELGLTPALGAQHAQLGKYFPCGGFQGTSCHQPPQAL